MKTVLHTIDTTGPGGAETVFVDLATRLPSDRFRPVVVIRGEGWVCDELRRRGVEPILLDARGSFNLSYLLGLRKIIRQNKIDVIQSHLLGTNVYCSLAGMQAGVPVVATFHGEVDIAENERFKRLKFAAINAGAKHVVAVTDSLRDDIVKRTPLKSGRVSVIYNGIDTSAFSCKASRGLRDRYGWSEEEVLVGALGNIRPAKGYEFLLETAGRLVQSGHKIRFVIAGEAKNESPLLQELLALRQRLKLEQHVRFLGFTDDAARYLADIDIFFSSSVSEGLPLSAIQAMASGTPVVATRCGGYVSLIEHGMNGLLADVADSESMAAAIGLLACDIELQCKLAAEAKKRVRERYDIDVMLKAYQSLYLG